jgi:3-phenylpropionate/cinnamic acid dioxygenase small subunit
MKTFLPVSAEIFSAIQQFLIHETHLLDHNCFENWTALLCPDMTYSVHHPQGPDPHTPPAYRMIEGSRLLLEALHQSVRAPSSMADPRAYHIRRCVTNINVSFAHCRDEFAVASYLQIQGVQRSNGTLFTCTAERSDHLRRTAMSFRIISREIFLDSIEPAAFVLPALL